jgi:hypothetical protein
MLSSTDVRKREYQKLQSCERKAARLLHLVYLPSILFFGSSISSKVEREYSHERGGQDPSLLGARRHIATDRVVATSQLCTP